MPVTVCGRLGSKNIQGKLNGGGNLLTVHTGDGSIHLVHLAGVPPQACNPM